MLEKTLGRIGASEGIRTLDTHVGNVMLYQAELRSLPNRRNQTTEILQECKSRFEQIASRNWSSLGSGFDGGRNVLWCRFGQSKVLAKDSGFFARMLFGNQHVDGRNHQQGEDGAERHAGNDGNADRIARRSAGARDQRQREVAADRGGAGHQHRAQADQRGLAHGLELGQAAALEFVGKLDDEDAVLRDQADEGDQADLRVDVQGGGPAVGEEAHPGPAS